ncbi:MAG: DEAD/DEAH box helicase, partial [Candidatus Hydrogenedentes bacterium]|nr:DEAD/DEAH box helicase [Candidatus Hydrogenedentota bacterium]
MSFEEFDLDPRCLHVLNQQSITEPTPVQDQAIPIALEGKDLVAVAQTGTGKTLAFALPSLTRLAQGKIKRNLMLVLLPTRELCTQVHEVIDTLGKAMHINAVPIYGGVSIDKQANQLRKGMTVIVATPGRLLDQMGRKNVRFDNLEILVLDEADRMLDMGFLPDVKRIVSTLSAQRQTLFFSATLPPDVVRLGKVMLTDP